MIMKTASFGDHPVAVVTGGARGIGLAICEWFLKNHYKVVILDNNQVNLDETVRRIGKPDVLIGIHCDISNYQAVETAAKKIISTFGHVDALVNNAGVAIFKPVLETSFEDFRTVLSTNLDGCFICSQIFGKLIVENGGGAIVNIASISGLRASTLRVAYGTSKAGIIHLTKQYAVELGNYNVRVNAIAPGPVDTEMAKLVHSVAIRADYHDTIPLERYGTPEEMANAVGFLCSAEASFVNGQILSVDGGFEAAGVGLPTLRRNIKNATPN
jgi:NAD(P)-dependent dehydrogenase (short-subunit alcohol dehydrogenase family)